MNIYLALYLAGVPVAGALAWHASRKNRPADPPGPLPLFACALLWPLIAGVLIVIYGKAPFERRRVRRAEVAAIAERDALNRRVEHARAALRTIENSATNARLVSCLEEAYSWFAARDESERADRCWYSEIFDEWANSPDGRLVELCRLRWEGRSKSYQGLHAKGFRVSFKAVDNQVTFSPSFDRALMEFSAKYRAQLARQLKSVAIATGRGEAKRSTTIPVLTHGSMRCVEIFSDLFLVVEGMDTSTSTCFFLGLIKRSDLESATTF